MEKFECPKCGRLMVRRICRVCESEEVPKDRSEGRKHHWRRGLDKPPVDRMMSPSKGGMITR